MLKTYEATYDHGKLKWIRGRPVIEDGRQVLVVVDGPKSAGVRLREEIQKALDESLGAWGTGKTLDEIDREINAMRAADWDRNWISSQ